MKTEKYTHLRAQVQKIEEKILAITGRNAEFNMEWTRSQRKREQVERLIWKRKHLLDEMFVATTDAVKRMEQLNNRLHDLTHKMLSRTEALYRNLMTATYDPEFDDLNNGSSWYMPSLPSADKLNHLCICHAIYELSCHKPYSIPDILRMNDFCVEVNIKHQHWE